MSKMLAFRVDTELLERISRAEKKLAEDLEEVTGSAKSCRSVTVRALIIQGLKHHERNPPDWEAVMVGSFMDRFDRVFAVMAPRVKRSSGREPTKQELLGALIERSLAHAEKELGLVGRLGRAEKHILVDPCEE